MSPKIPSPPKLTPKFPPKASTPPRDLRKTKFTTEEVNPQTQPNFKDNDETRRQLKLEQEHQDCLTETLLQAQYNKERVVPPCLSEEIDVDPLFCPWKSFIRIIEDKDIAPYKTYDAPSNFEFEWDLPILPNI